MNLDVHLPFCRFLAESHVSRLVVETIVGSYGILPRRLDCVAALTPGLLIYQVEGREEAYVAVDEGVLVKVGRDVRIAVRHAVLGRDLKELRQVIHRDYLALDEHEQAVRRVTVKLEMGLIRRLVDYHHDERY